MQRIQYGRLLQKQIDREPTLERYLKRAENALELKSYGEAAEILDVMEENWPDREAVSAAALSAVWRSRETEMRSMR